MSNFTNDTNTPSPPEPFLRVMTSHFSGVVTIICQKAILTTACLEYVRHFQHCACVCTCVVSISRLVNCMSPVSSRTDMPSGFSFSENFSCTSWASAFIGATYTILKSSFWRNDEKTRVWVAYPGRDCVQQNAHQWFECY